MKIWLLTWLGYDVLVIRAEDEADARTIAACTIPLASQEWPGDCVEITADGAPGVIVHAYDS